MTTQNQNLMGRHAIIEHIGNISTYSESQLSRLLSTAALAAKATILNQKFHAFGEGMGVTGVLMLAESHISVHTWPENNNYSAIDIFVCSDNDGLNAAIDVIKDEDPNAKMSVRIIDRLVPQPNQSDRRSNAIT